jgi:hypothetical protein
MNKARRHELKMLKYKKRLKQLGLKESPTSNLFAYRSHGAPCSCGICSYNKYKRIQKKAREVVLNELSAEELVITRLPAYEYLIP